MSFLSQLEWRFATKSFDPEKKVSDEDFEKIKQAMIMAPSSFGIQPYHFIVVTDPELREKIKAASWGQPQVTDASHLIVLCARTDISQRIDETIDAIAEGDEEKKVMMKDYANMMHGALDPRSDADKFAWAARQAYIAFGFGMAACAELNIDSCPMEGLDTAKVDEILELPATVKTLAYMTVGYRKQGPERDKFRFSEDDLFTVK